MFKGIVDEIRNEMFKTRSEEIAEVILKHY